MKPVGKFMMLVGKKREGKRKGKEKRGREKRERRKRKGKEEKERERRKRKGKEEKEKGKKKKEERKGKRKGRKKKTSGDGSLIVPSLSRPTTIVLPVGKSKLSQPNQKSWHIRGVSEGENIQRNWQNQRNEWHNQS